MTRGRLSLAYFADLVPDTVIEPLPECVDDGHPRLFDPVTIREIFQNGYKMMESRYGEEVSGS